MNEKIFINAISTIAEDKKESAEKIYKEVITQCVNLLQFQQKYLTLDEREKFQIRDVRNNMICDLFITLRDINKVSLSPIFTFDMPLNIRPFERGKRINDAIQNLINVTEFFISHDVKQLLKECI